MAAIFPVSDKGNNQGWAIRRRLSFFASAFIVTYAVAAAVLLTYSYYKERVNSEFQLQATARALSIAVDRQLGHAEALLQALATMPALDTGDFATFDRQARKANIVPNSWIVLQDKSGRQLVNTRLPPGEIHNDAMPQKAFEPAATSTGLTFGESKISDLLTSPFGSSIVSLLLPVLRDGMPVYDLIILLSPSEFDSVFSDQNLPESWIGVIVDRNGHLIGRSQNSQSSVGRTVNPVLLNALKNQVLDGIFEARSREGVQTTVAYSRPATAAWTFAVAVPRDAFGAAARRSLYAALAIGLVFFVIGGLFARRVASGISTSIEELTRRATALGRGEAVSQEPTGLLEADIVADSLFTAGEALQGLTTNLEQRVAERTRDLAESNRRLSNEIEERQRAEHQLARVQRMEVIGQLSGGVAHDFNNLLQAIIGNLDRARRRIDDPKIQTMLDHALSASARGAKLTAQLLAFARRQRLEPAPLDVNALIAGLIDMVQSTMGGSVSVETVMADGLWWALADATQLELIVLNLTINARDAMPGGGTITIETANVTRAEPQRQEEPPAGDYVEISVGDDGAGMPPDVLGKVFEPFFTTKEVGKGSGLGLSQVLGLAQQLGGGVTIDSQPGVGTVVRVYLPRTSPAKTATLPDAGGDAVILPGATILMVDDDPDVRMVLSAMLREFGCIVTDVESGQYALSQLADRTFDVLLLDYAMPGMNGAEVARRARAIRPDIPVLFVTGYSATAELPPGLSVDNIVSKPVRAGELIERLEAILRR